MDRLRIQNNNIEKLANLGYWEWWPVSNQATCSSGFVNMFGFIEKTVSPASLICYIKENCLNNEYVELIEYLQSLKKKQLPTVKTFAIPTADKSVKYFEINAFSTQLNDIEYFAGTVQEVTERVKYNILKEKELNFEKKIAEIASRFVNDNKFNSAIATTLSDLGQLCNAERISLLKIENNIISEEFDWKNSLINENCIEFNKVPIKEVKFLINLIKEQKLIYYQNISEFPRVMSVIKDSLKNNQVSSIIISGIRKKQQTIGALIITQNNKTRKWDFSDIHMVKMTCIILSNAIKQKVMHKTLKESEKRLQFALLAGNLGTWEINLKTNTKYYDERNANIYGYTSGTLNNTKNWFQQNIHKDYYNTYFDILDECIEGHKSYYEFEYKIRCKNGSYKWVNDMGIVTQTNKNGVPTKMVGIVQDISQRKNAEGALIVAKEKAEENEKLKTAFLANISHEIRTPINGISGFAELLYKNAVSEGNKNKYLEIIWKNSNRLLALINNIFDISKLETGQFILFEKEYSLNEIFDDIYRKLKITIENSKNIEFEISNSIDYQTGMIKIDGTRLKQVLFNLIENAFKFTEKGKININCELNTHGDLQFCIKDTGPGIPKEFHNQLFDRFTQSELTIKHNLGGTGLGLPISKGIIENMGGTIWVKSLNGIGTTFYFTLPYKPTKASVKEFLD